MLVNFIGQNDEERCLRRHAGGDAIQLSLIGGEAGQSFFGHRIAFVGNVVGAARKAVDGLDRPAQVPGNEEGGNGEVFVVIDGHRPRSIGSSRHRW